MKQTIDFARFQRGFESAGRLNQWSDHGLEILFNHLIELEKASIAGGGDEWEFDPVEICCSYSEYSLIEFLDDRDHSNPVFDWLLLIPGGKDRRQLEEYLNSDQEAELKSQVQKVAADQNITIAGISEGRSPVQVVVNTDTF